MPYLAAGAAPGRGRRGARRAAASACGRSGAHGAVLAGCGGFLAYVLVLAALRLAPAAPVAAVRETSVLFAVALAAPFLGERVTSTPPRGSRTGRRRGSLALASA